jgi:hypothetical protein
VSRRTAGRLAVVSVPAAGAVEEVAVPASSEPATAEVGRSRLPGLGARFLASLSSEAGRRGWTEVETLGLIVAAEERCALWVVAARSFHRQPRVMAWRTGRLVQAAGGLDAVVAAAAAAPARMAVCLAAVSAPAGSPAPPVLAALREAGARVGRVDDGLAATLRLPWAVEVLIAPALAPESLAGLRERISSAPRCAWCRLPVLGSSCSRCRRGGE